MQKLLTEPKAMSFNAVLTDEEGEEVSASFIVGGGEAMGAVCCSST